MAPGLPTIVKKEVSIEALLSQAIDKGVPVETMERLLAMRTQLKREAAKEAFDMAMAKFQAECPVIQKTKAVRNNGQIVYKYEPIEGIVSQVRLPLRDNGFSYSTGMELKELGVKVTVKVTHELGHSEETSMEVPFGAKTGIMSHSQVTAAATTFAKRYAFCNAFGILTGDEDTDATPVRMAPYKVERDIDAQDDEPQGKRVQTPEVDELTTQKQEIMSILQSMGHTKELLSKKTYVTRLIESKTNIRLVDENIPDILERLRFLIAEGKSE